MVWTLSSHQTVPIHYKTWFLPNVLLLAQKVTSLPLFVSFYRSTFPLRIDGRSMGSTDVYATTTFLTIFDMKFPFLPHESEPKRLLVPLSTKTKCGLQYIHLFPQIMLPPLGTPVFFFLKFLLLAMCPAK